MDSHHLRALILKIQDHLSDNDRRRLHFFLGTDVPRRIRDDPSLVGTLNLMECLFDQDKINERDFTFLINAFDEIQCIDAVKILREHMKKMHQYGQKQSIKNLTSILLQDQDEDKYGRENLECIQSTINGDNNIQINHNTKNINPAAFIVDKYSSRMGQRRLLKLSTKTTQFLLLFAILLNVGLAVAVGYCTVKIFQLNKKLEERTVSNLVQSKKTNKHVGGTPFVPGELDYCLQRHDSADQMKNVDWVDAQDGDIPPYAFEAGQEGNRRVYVTRIDLAGNTIPGKLIERNKLAEAEYHGPQARPTYQVLTNPGSKKRFKWVPTCHTNVPACGILAGKEGQIDLYVGRVFTSSGIALIGKYNTPNGPLYYLDQGVRKEANTSVEILCVV